jgi:TRAP-type mannitol/chloroaromatic compound transport system permease small subunit
MLVINSIEKSRLQADSFSYSGGGVAWKARFVLFLGFALLAGGLAGSVVRSLFLPRWIIHFEAISRGKG